MQTARHKMHVGTYISYWFYHVTIYIMGVASYMLSISMDELMQTIAKLCCTYVATCYKL